MTQPWPPSTRRTGRPIDSIVSRMWGVGCDSDGGLGGQTMRPNHVVWVWLLAVGLAGCVASQMGEPPRRLAATDTLVTAGDIQVAQEHVRAFGFDPGPVQGVFTAQTQAAVEAYQARYGLPVTGLLDEATRRQVLPGFNRIRR